MSKDNQERLARQWAEKYLRYADESDSAELYAAAQIIKANTTKPTMADVEWSDEKHFLAEATDGDGDAVVMCGENAEGEISVIVLWDHLNYSTPKGQLTPNGKSYKLVEVTADEHPETLSTVEDYEDAPQGTIVALADSPPWSKTPSGGWRQAGDYRTSPEMVGAKRKMLRWGWGE